LLFSSGSTPAGTSPVPDQVLPSAGELVSNSPRALVVSTSWFLPCNTAPVEAEWPDDRRSTFVEEEPFENILLSRLISPRLIWCTRKFSTLVLFLSSTLLV